MKKDFRLSPDNKMDISTNFVKLVFCIFCVSFVNGADVCVKRSACSCVFPNGTGIDLTPSAKNSVYTSVSTYEIKNNGTQMQLSTFYYHPCYDVVMATPTPVDTNTCKDSLSLCSFVSSWLSNSTTDMKKKGDSYNFLGSVNFTEFDPNGKYIKYANAASASLVYLVCAETDDELFAKDLSEPNAIILQFLSRNACLRQIESGRSTGSTLLIIFFCFVIFYLVLGVCTKKFLMGATGIEVIPNLMFWTELPVLVKDGWAFMMNGFKLPARGPGAAAACDPNSYDSI